MLIRPFRLINAQKTVSQGFHHIISVLKICRKPRLPTDIILQIEVDPLPPSPHHRLPPWQIIRKWVEFRVHTKSTFTYTPDPPHIPKKSSTKTTQFWDIPKTRQNRVLRCILYHKILPMKKVHTIRQTNKTNM